MKDDKYGIWDKSMSYCTSPILMAVFGDAGVVVGCEGYGISLIGLHSLNSLPTSDMLSCARSLYGSNVCLGNVAIQLFRPAIKATDGVRRGVG